MESDEQTMKYSFDLAQGLVGLWRIDAGTAPTTPTAREGNSGTKNTSDLAASTPIWKYRYKSSYPDTVEERNCV